MDLLTEVFAEWSLLSSGMPEHEVCRDAGHAR